MKNHICGMVLFEILEWCEVHLSDMDMRSCCGGCCEFVHLHFVEFNLSWIEILLDSTVGFKFCCIQFLLDSIFAGFNFCWIQDLLALLVLCAGIQAPQTDAFDRCPT